MRRFSAVLFVLACLAGCARGQGELRPLRPAIPPAVPAGGQPQLVTFDELQADPAAYRDHFIRVTAVGYLLPPAGCYPSAGPPLAWALVAQELRLDVLSLVGLAGRVAPETTFTLDGFFRFYAGPLGCGKEPAAGQTWYLEALRIVQPNPLVFEPGGGAAALVIVPAPISAGSFTTPPPATSPEASPAATSPGPPGLPSVTRLATPQPTAPGTPAATPTASPAVTPSATGTAQATSTPAASPTGQATEPAPTATPAGYPAPPPPPAPQPTPPSYP
ncbi:MAG: hypothetical protein ACRDHL_02685 [Candidatus Promineifilaceae bacterium]